MPLKKEKRIKKPTTSQLKKKADKYFSLAIRYRDSEFNGSEWVGSCITCESRVRMKDAHAGHFQSRRYLSTRWDEENVNMQCVRCNTYNAGEQYKYAIALDLKYGDGTAKKLAKEARLMRPFKTWELEQIIHDSIEEVRFYESQSASSNT